MSTKLVGEDADGNILIEAYGMFPHRGGASSGSYWAVLDPTARCMVQTLIELSPTLEARDWPGLVAVFGREGALARVDAFRSLSARFGVARLAHLSFPTDDSFILLGKRYERREGAFVFAEEAHFRPGVSPDGRWIAQTRGSRDRLEMLSVAGGRERRGINGVIEHFWTDENELLVAYARGPANARSRICLARVVPPSARHTNIGCVTAPGTQSQHAHISPNRAFVALQHGPPAAGRGEYAATEDMMLAVMGETSDDALTHIIELPSFTTRRTIPGASPFGFVDDTGHFTGGGGQEADAEFYTPEESPAQTHPGTSIGFLRNGDVLLAHTPQSLTRCGLFERWTPNRP